MGRISAKSANLLLNSVQLNDELNSIELAIDVEVPEVTAFADAAKSFVEGKYGFQFSIEGSGDVLSGQGDATIFALLGGGEVAAVHSPTGAAEGANDPEYGGNVILSSYRLTSAIGSPLTYSATLIGSGALTRDVSA